MDQNSVPIYRVWITDGRRQTVEDLYFESDNEYGPKALFSEVRLGDQAAAPGFKAHFINPAYVDAVPDYERRDSMSWKRWLHFFGNVQHIPRLTNSSGTQLTDVFAFLIEHRGSKLVGTLKEHWSSYRSMKPEIKQILSKARVSCEDVPDTPLKETYMPFPKLKEICNRLGVGGKLPFVKLPVELDENLWQDWDFLRTFQVIQDEGLDFYLDILRQFVRLNRNLCNDLSTKAKEDLFTIYGKIDAHRKSVDPHGVWDFFNEETAIYVQSSRGPVWAKPGDCVWKAPKFFDLRYSLANTKGYVGREDIKMLFGRILLILDAGPNDYIEQIKVIKEKQISWAKMADIYRHIQLDVKDDMDWQFISKEFEQHCLVYVGSQNAWASPSSCLWTGDTRIPGKAAIANYYLELDEFFVNGLGVPKPDLGMYVDALTNLSKDGDAPPFEKVRDLIRDINSFRPSKDALQTLRFCNILPVRDTNGRLALRNTTEVFAIFDRVHFIDIFKAKVPRLDFDLEEIHQLQPLLSGLSLGNRYLSQLVKESSTVNGCDLDVELSRDIQGKAHAFFRCAVHFDVAKPHDQNLYHRLLASKVYRSSGITKNLTVSIDEFSTTFVGADGSLHIEEDNTQFRLYVPKDENELEICYLSHIPRKLAGHMAITDPAAVKILGDVVKATKPALLGRILDDEGIVPVPGMEYVPPVVNEPPLVRTSVENQGEGSQFPPINHHSPSSSLSSAFSRRASTASTFTDYSSPNFTSNREASTSKGQLRETTTPVRRDSDSPSSGLSPDPRRQRAKVSLAQAFVSKPQTARSTSSLGLLRHGVQPDPAQGLPGATETREVNLLSDHPRVSRQAPQDDETFNVQYRNLLDGVISAAARDNLPSVAPMASATATSNATRLPDAVFGSRTTDQISHDIKIGAAGELYVFELLLKQDLIGFSRSNWRSTIRKNVCVHEKYINMEPWQGRETADIVYEDVGPEYRLTNILAGLGYFCAGNPKPGTVVTYYLEVKTTRDRCDTRFYMSKAQYNRMHGMTLSGNKDELTTEIYIVMRVFNLGKDDMGLRLYADPATMEREGKLKFEIDHYLVTPGPILDTALVADSDEEL